MKLLSSRDHCGSRSNSPPSGLLWGAACLLGESGCERKGKDEVLRILPWFFFFLEKSNLDFRNLLSRGTVGAGLSLKGAPLESAVWPAIQKALSCLPWYSCVISEG